MLLIAVGLDALLYLWICRRRSLPLPRMMALFMIALIVSAFGAKLYHVFMASTWGEPYSVRSGGYRYPGSLLGVIVSAVLLRKFVPPPMNWCAWGDVLTAPFALGLATGRIGCLLTGCCFGDLCTWPWGITYPPGSNPYFLQQSLGIINQSASATLPVHPLPIYLFILELALCVAAYSRLDRVRFDGEIALSFLTVHSIGKLGLEFLRFRYDPWHQIPLAVIGGVAAMLLIGQLRRQRHARCLFNAA